MAVEKGKKRLGMVQLKINVPGTLSVKTERSIVIAFQVNGLL